MVDAPRHDADEDQPLMTDSQRREADAAAPGDGHGHGHGSVDAGALGPRHPDAPPLDAQHDDGSDGQDEHAGRRRRWKSVPYPLRRVVRAVARWSRGPVDAQPHRIRPLLPAVQQFPLRLVERVVPKRRHRAWLLFFYLALWLVTFVVVKWRGAMATEIAGWGQPQTIGCGASYWAAGNTCGLHGDACRPFDDGGFAFRCPANCRSYRVLNPRAVGDQEVVYQPLVVGGPTSDVQPELATYRGDSYICAAAVHAGLISNQNGGCGVVTLVGRQQKFVSSQRNDMTSVAFDSYFPLSFRFVPGIDCASQDARWPLLIVSAVFTAVLSLLTASPPAFFFPSFVGIFWTVGMALDSPPHKSVAALFSNILGKFLPAMFVAWVMYDKMGVRRTLHGLTAQVEKTVLWLGACWVGAMSNYTLDFIPIQRLNKHDLDQQPGAKAALSIIIIVLVVVIASQVWFFRQEARFVKYIKLYAMLVAGIVMALLLPELNLRIHHYILALLLLPGTSLQMRPSLLYQGLLMGLFINGIARWGFDPVLQTSIALQGDAQLGSPLPTIGAPAIDLGSGADSLSNITFGWDSPVGIEYDGISVLVNDVEQFRSYFSDVDAKTKFVWSRNSTLNLPEYFRFALMTGSESGDYTKAGTWTADGTWKDMAPGPSKMKRRSVDQRLGRRSRAPSEEKQR